MADERETLLNELHASLEALISGLESGLGEDALAGLWATCDGTFARFRVAQEAQASAELSDELRKKLEAALRLQAVVASLAARQRDELTSEAEKLTNARARLESLAARAHVGQSCDLLG